MEATIVRPSKLTPESRKRILDAIRAEVPCKHAAAPRDVSEGAFYRWMEHGAEDKAGPCREFHKAVLRAKKEDVAAPLALVQKAAQRDWCAAACVPEGDLPEAFCLRFKIEPSSSEPTFAQGLASGREDRQPQLLKEAETL